MDEQMSEEEYRDLEEEAQFANYPKPEEQGSIYDLFRKVLLLPDSSKVGNLAKIELGMLPYSVRDCQRIAELASLYGHEKFADYFRKLAEIILKTSNSKRGWFTELFVSRKKFSAQRTGFEELQGGKKSKWNFQRTDSPQAAYQ
jgi:hypothetical protein